MNNLILKAYNLHKRYPSGYEKLDVLKGLDIEISKGEILMVMGRSGAGKSTLLHILGGLDFPSEGRVLMNDVDIYKLNDSKRASLRNEKIGFIFQFFHLLPEFTALENVMLPAVINKARRAGRKGLRKRASRLIEQVGLSERANHRPGELSGGEQQRVAVARALINEPELVLCDEPTGNLDSENSGRLVDLLKELNNKNKQTFMIVSHDETISEAAHRVVKIEDGRIIGRS
ncbi:MAG: ABC transporter ATP-binding protein [Candidatus Omnitrophica bacterium]|nr:ABC transporter ATP-binding protein [Candidatus Omnitrophota bacterium]